MHVFRKSLICIRPVYRLAGRGHCGLRTRLDLISDQVDHDHLGFCGCRPGCKKFLTFGEVIECGLLSGLIVRHFQKPRAGMVISGLGPNLSDELVARSPKLVFPIQIYSIMLPIQIIVFSPPVSGFRLCRPFALRRPQSSPDLDNLLASSAQPRWCGPFYWPVQLQQASLVCVSTCSPAKSRPGQAFVPPRQCASLPQ